MGPVGPLVRPNGTLFVANPSPVVFEQLDPKAVNLGDCRTRNQQRVIRALHEGDTIHLTADARGSGWLVTTSEGICVGSLSREGCARLARRDLYPGRFRFAADEVRVKSIYHHINRDQDTGAVNGAWEVVVPSVSVWR